MKKAILLLFILYIGLSQAFSQVYSNKEIGKEAKADTVKPVYPYLLPIWGQKVTDKGFKLPYSAGLGVNYLWQESDIVIENLFVGFNNGPQYNLDEIIRFDNSRSTAAGINIRPDIWLFPFLNVYGVFGKAKTATSIEAGAYLPDTTGTWNEIGVISTTANFDATTFGLGLTPTIGVGGGWFALDMNMTWTDISALEKPAFAFVFGPRFGKTFKMKKEDMSLTFWTGAFRLHLKSETSGSLDLTELFNMEELQTKVDDGIARVDEAQQNVDTWWNGLTPPQKLLPSNKAKYETANRVIDKTGAILAEMDGALNDEQTASVQYSLDKRPKDMWNFLLGTQFQLNRHIMIRAEYGFLGSRQQFIGGLQYRFGL